MKITLVRSGGIIPMTKKSEKEVDWSDDELHTILQSITVERKSPGLARDANSYSLQVGDRTIAVDWDKIPKKYQQLFDEMKDGLKIEKKG
jgi:hypothetical protein